MNIRALLVGCVSVLALGSFPSAAAPALATLPERDWPGFTRFGFWDVDVDGFYAYGSADQELVVFDIHNPTNPVPIGSYPIGARIQETQVEDGTAYVLNASGLLVLDVRDPARIRRLGAYPNLWFGEIHVVGDRAYLAGDRLKILDVSDPVAIHPLGEIAMHPLGKYVFPGFLYDVFVAGDRAYITQTNVMRVLDVSNPATPIVLGSFALPEGAWNIQVVGSRAYVSDGRFQILDVADPQNIVLLGAARLGPSYFRTLHVVGDLAYIGSHYQGLRVADIRDPANIVPLPVLPEIRGMQGLFAIGSYVYVAAVHFPFPPSSAGLWTFAQQTDPLRFAQVGGFGSQGKATRLQAVGSHVYLADGEDGLKVFDLDNASMLLRNIPGSAEDVEIQGSRAYVSGNDGLRIFDVTEPGNPIRIGHYKTNGVARDVDVVGTRAYLAAGSRGLEILDISDPANIMLLKSGVAPGAANAVEVHASGDYAYVLGLYSVAVSRISDPGPLSFRTVLGGSAMTDFQIVGKSPLRRRFLHLHHL